MSSHHFASAIEMLDWARDAIHELKISCDAFFNANNFREVREFDADSNQNVLKIVLVSKLPQSIPRKANEALLNIRHSLDRSIYAACTAIGHPPKDSIYFPWADSPTDLDYKLGAKAKPGKTPKIRVPIELWDVLRELEPYGRSDAYAGGHNFIRELAKIANRKHTIRLNFGAAVSGIDFPSFSGSMKGPAKFELGNSRWDTMKNEIVLARFPSSIETDYKYTLHMYVAFNESPPLKGANLIGALSDFLTYAQTVLVRLQGKAETIVGQEVHASPP